MDDVRTALPVAAVILAVAVAPTLCDSLLGNAAAMLLEGLPFVLAGAALQSAPFRYAAAMAPFLDCGCGAGPSARSLPAAAAAAVLFGPVVAGARLAAGMLAGSLRRTVVQRHGTNALGTLHGLLPAVAAGAGASMFLPLLVRPGEAPGVALVAGAAAAFVLSPCGLGAVGIAGAVRSAAPLSAIGFLCIAGIADLRSFAKARCAHTPPHDCAAYAIAALAAADVAWRGGDALVHPLLAALLWPCAAASAFAARRFRAHRTPVLRWAPAIMLAGAVLHAPMPQYHATETTLANAFPGERVDFTGVLTRTGSAATLVRYAITCCRADAMPIVIRLTAAPRTHSGWYRASGVLVETPQGIALRAKRVDPVAPPGDPFVYR